MVRAVSFQCGLVPFQHMRVPEVAGIESLGASRLLAAGALFLFVTFLLPGRRSLSFAELFGAYVASLREILRFVYPHDVPAPVYPLLFRIWITIFGSVQLALRVLGPGGARDARSRQALRVSPRLRCGPDLRPVAAQLPLLDRLGGGRPVRAGSDPVCAGPGEVRIAATPGIASPSFPSRLAARSRVLGETARGRS